MADPRAGLLEAQQVEPCLVEHLRDQPHVLLDADLIGARDADAARLLAAVLQREQPHLEHPGEVVIERSAVHVRPDDAALLVRVVVVVIEATQGPGARSRGAHANASAIAPSKAARAAASGDVDRATFGAHAHGLATDRTEAAGGQPGGRAGALQGVGALRRQRDEREVGGLAEERRIGTLGQVARQHGVDAAVAQDRHLGQRHRDPAVADVVRGRDHAVLDQARQRRDQPVDGREVELGRFAGLEGVDGRQVGGRAERRPPAAKQPHLVAVAREGHGRAPLHVGQDAHHADRRGRQHRADLAVGRAVLVVEADVAAGDGGAQRQARLAQPFDRLAHLEVDLRNGRVAEVEVVGHPQRGGADRRQVAGGLRDGQGGAATRREVHVPGVAVDGGRDPAPAPLDAQHGRIGRPWEDDRVRHDLVVVLAVDRALGGDVRPGEQGRERGARVLRHREVGERAPARGDHGGVLAPLPHVGRRLVERGDGHVADERVAIEDAEAPVLADDADRHRVEFPALEQRDQLALATGGGGQHHALLGFREHDLERRHPGLAARHPRHVEVDAQARPVRHLADRGGDAGGPHVLHAVDQPGGDRFEAGLEQQLLEEGVAHLHGGPIRVGIGAQVRGREDRAAQAVPSGLRTDVQEHATDGADGPRLQVLVTEQPERHHVDERVLLVAGVEGDLAADGRHADGVPVGRDALDHAVQQVARPLVLEPPEPQRVQDGDRPRTHREDVAQDAADARRGALHRLDRARVVVRFHLERQAPPLADVDDAGVLARALQHLRPLGRESPQQRPRVLVAAVLAP